MGFCQQLQGKFSKLTELYHITSEHTITFTAVKHGRKTISLTHTNYRETER